MDDEITWDTTVTKRNVQLPSPIWKPPRPATHRALQHGHGWQVHKHHCLATAPRVTELGTGSEASFARAVKFASTCVQLHDCSEAQLWIPFFQRSSATDTACPLRSTMSANQGLVQRNAFALSSSGVASPATRPARLMKFTEPKRLAGKHRRLQKGRQLM